MDNYDKVAIALIITFLVVAAGALKYYTGPAKSTTTPWIQVPESNTSFLPIDLSDGTRCVALKVEKQVAITCNWSTTQN